MAKKLSIMSLSIETEMHKLLKDHAKKRNMKVSEFVRNWIDKYPFNTTNVIPVVIDIPESMLRDKEALNAFLAKKSQAIVAALCG